MPHVEQAINYNKNEQPLFDYNVACNVINGVVLWLSSL